MSHAGDMGNIKSDSQGTAFVNKISRGQVSLTDGQQIAGRAVAICDGGDDMGMGGSRQSLKNGSCGKVVACGIIGLANTVAGLIANSGPN